MCASIPGLSQTVALEWIFEWLNPGMPKGVLIFQNSFWHNMCQAKSYTTHCDHSSRSF